jgi:DNA (cytosine-5)-methyltransferase 1
VQVINDARIASVNKLFAESLREKTSRTLSVFDLFCGCGGLSVGFSMDGNRVLAGVDHDAAALQTFSHNFPDAKALDVDLASRAVGKSLSTAMGHAKVDVVVAGPPCQGFSLTGPRNFDDPRNRLYLAVFDVVKELAPLAFVIENVRGMASLYGGQVRDEVSHRFAKLGYSTVSKILCAADYGVPQLRYRLFFVGLRSDLGVFEFPTPTHGPGRDSPFITCHEAIGDLPALEPPDFGDELATLNSKAFSRFQRMMRGSSKSLFNHVATRHTDVVREVIALVPAGGDHTDLPKGVGTHRKFNEAWTRYHPDRPSYTIDTGHRNHFHYSLNRVPTVRENARLQSFPDTFRFIGTRTQQNRQVGNAVPPILARAIANHLRHWV